MNNSRDKAVHLLQHYIGLAMTKEGRVDRDVDHELEQLVDCIIDASVEKTIDELAQRVKRAGRL